MSWIELLPQPLRRNVSATVAKYPETQPVFDHLYAHLYKEANPPKKRKVGRPPKKTPTPTPTPAPTSAAKHSPYTLSLATINPSEVIFQLLLILFQSPVRKRFHLVFHLLLDPLNVNPPEPVLSIVVPTTNEPELSIHKFSELVRLCMLVPMLGSSMQSKKRVAQLCLWLNDGSDPLVCQLNFDVIKEQLIEAGKIPPTKPSQPQPAAPKQESQSDSEVDDAEDDADVVYDAIIDFLQRQFQLCGINLVNYVPSQYPQGTNNKNVLSLETDAGVAVRASPDANQDSLVIVEAYKGSKEGSLLLLAANGVNAAHVIFGFKKPILVFELAHIKHVSYTNITRLTFSLLITIQRPTEREDVLEFGMIDQQNYSTLDAFIKAQRINDNSFDDELREKTKKEGGIEGNSGSEEEGEAGAGAQDGGLSTLQASDLADSDDEDEDGTYHVGVEEDASAASGGSDSNSDSDEDSNLDSDTDEAEEAAVKHEE